MIHLMIFVVISSSFLTRIVQAAPVGSFSENDVMDEDPQTTTNAFIDDVIDMLRDLWGAQMDPLRIPRQKLSFEKSFIGFTIYGDATLDDAKLNGISRLHRTGNAILGPDARSGLQLADVTVGVENLNLTGGARFSILGASIHSPISLQLKALGVNIKSYLNNQSNKPILDDLLITRIDGITLDLPGLGSTGSTIVDLLASGILTLFKGSLKELIRSNLLKFVNGAVNRPNMKLN